MKKKPSKERALFLMWISCKGKIKVLMIICPLIAAEASPFPVVEKDQKTTAASDAMKGSALARVVIAAPAKAEERWGKDSARESC